MAKDFWTTDSTKSVATATAGILSAVVNRTPSGYFSWSVHVGGIHTTVRSGAVRSMLIAKRRARDAMVDVASGICEALDLDIE